jgi:hypothetical protein
VDSMEGGATAGSTSFGSGNSPVVGRVVAYPFSVIDPIAQIITVGALDNKTFGDAAFTVSAAGGASGNPVTFVSLTTSICTTGGANGATVTNIAAGTCTIRASQAGNTNFTAAASVDRSFDIMQAAQIITFGALANKTFGDAAFTVSATGGASGNPITFASQTPAVCTTSGINGTTVAIVSVGTCTIRASQAGNTNYSVAANVDRTLTVAQATQAINFPSPGNKTFGAAPFTLSATGGASGNPVIFTSLTSDVCSTSATNGSTVTIVAAGSCSLRASQAGNANYSAAADVPHGIFIFKAAQTITDFAPASPRLFGASPATLSASASSGLTVAFATTSAGTICTVTGNQVTFTGAGICSLTANQAGNTNFAAAPQVTASIVINQAAQTILFGTAPSISVGGTETVAATGGGSGNPVVFTSTTTSVCTISATVVSGVTAGTCTIAANQAGNASYTAAAEVTQSFNITALATFTITPSASVNGSITPATAIVVNSGATSTFTVTPSLGYAATVGGTCGGTLVGNTYTTNPIVANCSVIATFTLNVALTAVQSRKTHGAAGTFDLPILTTPLIGGSVTVEPRAIGAGHTIVFQFNQAVTSIGSVAALDSSNNPIGSASAVINMANNTEVLVTLTGIADRSRLAITLNGVNGGLSSTVSMGFLVGDVNNDREVRSSDLTAIKTRLGLTLDNTNFKYDVSLNGDIGSTDISAAKTRVGLALGG